MSQTNSTPARVDYPALTALRGILALIVILYHFQSNFSKVNFPLPGIIQRGHVAVSAFFILSGFILSKVYAGRTTSWTAFFRARFARVYPIYFLGIVAIAPIVVYSASLSKTSSSGLVVELLLTLACLQSWCASTWHTWNLVGWSICCEAFFYALFPFALTLLKHAKKPIYFITVGMAVLAGVAYQPSTLGYEDGQMWLHHHSPIIRLPEFILGMMVALLPTSEELISTKRALVIFLAALLVVIHQFPADSACAILVPLIWVSLIWILASAAFQRVPSVLLWLGNISYALYIFHIITASYTKPLAVKTFGDFAFIVQIAVCFPIAHYLYKFVEVPMREKVMLLAASKV